MNNTLSVKRIGLLLKAEWYEFRTYVIWGLVSAIGILVAILLSIDVNIVEQNMAQLFVYISFVTFFLGMWYVNFRSSSLRGLGFLIPARPAEKFITQFVVLIFILISSFAVFFLSAGIFSLIKLGGIDSCISYAFLAVLRSVVATLPLLTVMTIFWLCMITFQRKAFLKAFLILAAIGILVAWTSENDLIDYLFETNGINSIEGILPLSIENTYPGFLSIVQYRTWIFLLAVVVMFYIGYLKLKEKEQR